MRSVLWLSFLLVAGFFVGCSDATGIGGGRSVSGIWSGTVEREDIYLTLTEDDGVIHGSGSWGVDPVTVRGNRAGSDVSLVVEFHEYNPVNFQGTVSDGRLDGWLTGSGWQDEPAIFWRD